MLVVINKSARVVVERRSHFQLQFSRESMDLTALLCSDGHCQGGVVDCNQKRMILVGLVESTCIACLVEDRWS